MAVSWESRRYHTTGGRGSRVTVPLFTCRHTHARTRAHTHWEGVAGAVGPLAAPFPIYTLRRREGGGGLGEG